MAKTRVNAYTTTVMLIVFLILLGIFQPLRAETQIQFMPEDKFGIPGNNATIVFAFNGSYSEAKLENSTWIFRDLKMDYPLSFLGYNLSDSQRAGDLKVSCQDSNITIWAYLSFYYTLPVYSLVYFAEGAGKQTVNLGLNSTDPPDPSEWSVITRDNVFLAQGEGWTLLPDNTVIVSGLTGNVTIAHFELTPSEKSMLFSMQHSITIITGVILAAVVGFAVVIRIRQGRRKES